VRLWNTSTQVSIVESLRRHTGAVSGLVWADRGRVLASSADGEALLWDLRPATLREVICRVANRNLTRDEWSTFVGGTYRRTCPTHEAGAE
jgi:WD40 repeat protein